MSGWRLKKADGSLQRSDLTLAQVSELLRQRVFGRDDFVAGPKQERLLRIGDVAALRKFLSADAIANGPAPASGQALAGSATGSPAPVSPGPQAGKVPPRAPAGASQRPDASAAPAFGGAGVILRKLLRRGAEDEAELDLTAAIDVVFQLLIFFMVCGVIESAADVRLPATKSGEALNAHQCIVVSVGPLIGPDGQTTGYGYFVQNSPDAPKSLDQAVESTIAEAQADPSRTIVIKGDATASNKAIFELVRGLKQRSPATILRTGVQERQD